MKLFPLCQMSQGLSWPSSAASTSPSRWAAQSPWPPRTQRTPHTSSLCELPRPWTPLGRQRIVGSTSRSPRSSCWYLGLEDGQWLCPFTQPLLEEPCLLLCYSGCGNPLLNRVIEEHRFTSSLLAMWGWTKYIKSVCNIAQRSLNIPWFTSYCFSDIDSL